MLQKTRYFLFLITVLVMIVVAFQNHHEVDIQILFFSGRYPLTLLLLATSAVSFLLGSVWMVWRARKRAHKRETSDRKQQPHKIRSKKETSSQANAPDSQPADAVDELTGDAHS